MQQGILFIDTETTGFPKFDRPRTAPEQPHVVQLAAMLTDTSGAVIEEACVLVRSSGWTIPVEAERVHGISTAKSLADGVPVNDALRILDRLSAAADTLIAHNLEFDLFLVESEYERAGKTSPFARHKKRCTMKETTNIVRIPSPRRPGDFKWPTLTEAHRFFLGTTFDGAHDALVDARACAAVYFKCRDQLGK